MWITRDLMVIAWKPLVQSQDSNILFLISVQIFLFRQWLCLFDVSE